MGGAQRLRRCGARRDPDKVSGRAAKALRGVSDLELLQAPGLPFTLPREYRGLPHLIGAPALHLTLGVAALHLARTLRRCCSTSWL